MSELSIRPFAWRDVPEITAIYRHYVDDSVVTFDLEAPGEAFMAEKFGHMVDLGHPVIVAERDGRRARLCLCLDLPAAAGLPLHLRGFGLLRARRAGPGASAAALLSRVIELSRAFGFRQMIAVITAESAKAPSGCTKSSASARSAATSGRLQVRPLARHRAHAEGAVSPFAAPP